MILKIAAFVLGGGAILALVVWLWRTFGGAPAVDTRAKDLLDDYARQVLEEAEKKKLELAEQAEAEKRKLDNATNDELEDKVNG